MVKWITEILSGTGPAGIFVAMLLESACVPVPSEVVLPFAGIMVAREVMSFWEAVGWGLAGQMAGSALAWTVGRYGGRPFLDRYGRYLLLRRHELDRAERWFARWGEVTALAARLLPGVRTFISLPAGVARMPLGRFLLYSALGALPWTAALVWLGVSVGEVWDDPKWHWLFRGLDALVVLGALGLVAWVARRAWRGRRRRQGEA